MDKIIYPTQKELVELNKNIVKKYDGTLGIISSERISETLEEMKKAEDIIRKASMLMHGIITKQPFADGNRRTGYEAAKAFLNINGVKLIAKDSEIEIVVDKVLANMMTRNELKKWFKNHTRE